MPWTPPTTRTIGEVITAAKWNTDLTDNLNALDRGVPMIRHVGTTPFEVWYPCGQAVCGAAGVVSYGINNLTALPFVSVRGGTLDRLAFEVTTGGTAGSVARVGIYQATSDTNIYPNTRIVDGGEFVTTSTGVKAATISTTLAANTLYWAVYLTGTAAPTIRTIPEASILNIIGKASTLGVPDGPTISVAFTYAALPATFPTGAVRDNNLIGPMIAVRYSA